MQRMEQGYGLNPQTRTTHQSDSYQVQENGHEEIPLNRMTSTEERAEKERIRRIFENVSIHNNYY